MAAGLAGNPGQQQHGQVAGGLGQHRLQPGRPPGSAAALPAAGQFARPRTGTRASARPRRWHTARPAAPAPTAATISQAMLASPRLVLPFRVTAGPDSLVRRPRARTASSSSCRPNMAALLVRLGVVIAEQVQDAVRAQQFELVPQRVPRLGGLVGGHLGAEHHVAEQPRRRVGFAAARPGPRGRCRAAAGRSSSIGKASTSVGPGSPIQRSCRSDMVARSTSRTDSSASGCIRMPSRTCRASAARSASSTSTPDSLAISMLTGAPAHCARLRRGRGGVPRTRASYRS